MGSPTSNIIITIIYSVKVLNMESKSGLISFNPKPVSSFLLPSFSAFSENEKKKKQLRHYISIH